MRLHRFIGDFDISKKKIEIRDKNLINQIMNVLRLKEGESCILCDGKGREAQVRIQSLTKSVCLVTVGIGTIVATE
ncbi:MAG: hypothetical protein Q7R79_01105 [bacterium]|nr:hypothetical protein [bacterium]